MIWSLNVIISYDNGDWESSQFVKDKNGLRSHGPNPVALVPDLFAALQLNNSQTPFYRQDVSSVVYRFSALSANGSINVAGGINNFFISNNLSAITSELSNDTDFSQSFLSNDAIYIFDQDFDGSLLPLYFDNDGVRVGSVYRNYSQLLGDGYRYSTIFKDLQNNSWVILVNYEGTEGKLLKLDQSLNIAQIIDITGGLGDGMLFDGFEPIRAVAYDENKFLVIQEDRKAYYLFKTGQLQVKSDWSLDPPTSDGSDQPDSLSLFRYEGNIYCLFESTVSVGIWRDQLGLFENFGEIKGLTEDNINDILGAYYQSGSGKYMVFVRYYDSEIDDTIWVRANLTMPTLDLEIIEPIYGFDDDLILYSGPSIPNTSIGYGSSIDDSYEAPFASYYFHDLENEEVTMSIPFSYLKQNISAEQLLLQYKESPHTQLSITSLTIDGASEGYTLIARTPPNFNYEELRLKYASDVNNKYLFYFSD